MFHPRRKEPTARSNLALEGYVREVVSHTCPDDLLMRFFGWPNIEAIPGRITGRIADHYEQPRDAVIVAFVNRRPVGYTDVARFSSSFDFSVVGGISKQRVVELSQGDYLAKKESIILIGNPGLGKTHVATGLALAACQQGKKVRFFGAAGLVNDLQAAQKELRLSKFMRPFLKHDLIVLDEVGFIPFTTEGAQLLFQFCSDIYERVSIIVTTNLRFGDWNSVFGNETMTTALLDRLTGKGHILEFIGESYRFRQRLRQEEQQSEESKTETG